MLYRLTNGSLIEINRNHYMNDTKYYEAIYKYINSIILKENYFYTENTKTKSNINCFDELMGNSNDNIINYRKI